LIWDFSVLNTGPNIDLLSFLCSSGGVEGRIGNEVCMQVRLKKTAESPLLELTPETRFARIQFFSISQEYSKALGLLDSLGNEDDAAVILALGHLFSSAELSNDLEAYFQALIRFATERPNDSLLQLLSNYQLSTYSKFLMTKEAMSRLVASPLTTKMLFAVLAPHIEQAILYGEYNEALKLFNALDISFEKIAENDLFSYLASNHKSIIHTIQALGKDGSAKAFAVGSHIYLFGVIPTCLARPPKPLRQGKTRNCGFMSFDGQEVNFVKKMQSDLGQTPVRLFSSAQENLSGTELPSELEIKILNRLIYCFKGSQRRFSCTRKDLVEKKTVQRWFARLNKGEKRQKHWYFDEIYFEPDAWPNYYSSLVGDPVSLGFGPSESYYHFKRKNQ
jgi:hypothetical protein